MFCLQLVKIMQMIGMIILTIKGTKLFISAVNLSARDNQRLLKLLRKGFARSVYWNEYKTESDNKKTTNKVRRFLESKFVGVGRVFVLVYTNPGNVIIDLMLKNII